MAIHYRTSFFKSLFVGLSSAKFLFKNVNIVLSVTVKQQQRCLRPCLLEPNHTFYDSPGCPALNVGK